MKKKSQLASKKPLRTDALSNGYVENIWLKGLLFYCPFLQVQEKNTQTWCTRQNYSFFTARLFHFV